MSVPEGAVPKPLRAELYLAVLNEDRYRPRLPGECELFMALRAEKQMPSCFTIAAEMFAITRCYFYINAVPHVLPITYPGV